MYLLREQKKFVRRQPIKIVLYVAPTHSVPHQPLLTTYGPHVAIPFLLGLVSSVISDLTQNVTNSIKGEVMVIFGINGRAIIQGVKLRLNGNPKMIVQSGEG